MYVAKQYNNIQCVNYIYIADFTCFVKYVLYVANFVTLHYVACVHGNQCISDTTLLAAMLHEDPDKYKIN